MNWTKKHVQYCLEQKISSGCATLMLQWFINKGQKNQTVEKEIDLFQFNNWVSKYRGTPYDRTTLTKAIAQIDERSKGLVQVIKSYTPYIKKILIRPLNLVLKLNSPKPEINHNSSTAKLMFEGDHKRLASKLLQQNIDQLDRCFQRLGFNYSADALHRIWRFAGQRMDNVKDAIKYMLETNQREFERCKVYGEPRKIRSPRGWLHDCLKYCWYLAKEVELPVFESISSIDNYLREAFKPDSVAPLEEGG